MSDGLEAYYGLPAQVKFCRNCVISNQRPCSEVEFEHSPETKKKAIHFDEEGVCDACRLNEKKDREIDWAEREAELIEVCNQHRRSDGRYDCIVPGSGGKDSVLASWLLKYKYGMHPLTVAWSPHLFTPHGWNNFSNWIHEGGFDNVLFTPNGKVCRILTRLSLQKLFHPFQPFILGQKNIGARYALMYDVPLVFYGENEAEYGNPIQDTVSALRSARFHAGANHMQMRIGGVRVEDLINEHGLSMNDVACYLPLEPEQVEAKKIEVHYMGYYVRWDPQEAFYFAVEKTKFVPNDRRTEGTFSKYNSIDDKTDPIHYWTILLKFGIGRASYEASQEIRNRKITRDEGVALVKKFDQEFPERYFPEFLEYVGMTRGEFSDLADRFRSPHLWVNNHGSWSLRHNVWQES